MAENWDYTKIGPKPLPLLIGEVSPTGQQIARDVRLKGYADDTKEAMARIVEWSDIQNSYAVEVNKAAQILYQEYYRQFSDVIRELTDTKETQSAPEIASARRGFQTLAESINNLSVNQINKNLGKLDSTYFTDEFIDSLMIGTIDVTRLLPGSVTIDRTSFIKNESNSSNLFDKSIAQIGVFINHNGGYVDSANYFTSDLYNVNEGQYIIYPARYVRVFDSAGTRIERLNTGDNNASYIVNIPAGGGSFEFSGALENLNRTQINSGSSLLPYEDYEEPIVTFPMLNFTNQQLDVISEKLVTTDESGGILVKKTGNYLELSSTMPDGQSIKMELNLKGGNNNVVNFSRTEIGGNTIHSNTDDIAPIRTFTTVGANHGYTNIHLITMTNHGKTTADLGSQWSDGVTTYTLLKIDGNTLTLGCPYTVSNGVVSSERVDPTGDLSHVSGATNTESIATSSRSTGQLYPSINNLNLKLILDGTEIIEDGNYFGDKLEVVEKYNVMDYRDVIDWSQANVGQSYANNSIKGVVELSNTYVFTEGLKAVTSHAIRALEKVSLGTCGFLQAIPITLSGHTLRRTMPGINVVGYNFDIGHNMTNYDANLYINDSHLIDGTLPPSYYVDWLTDSSGARKYGFSMGYIVDKTSSKNAYRLANTSSYWDLRATKKSYPIAIANKVLEKDDYLSFQGFRQYLVPESEVYTNVVVEDNQNAYIHSDYKQAISYASADVDGIGKDIQVLQSRAYSVLSDTVGTSGVPYKSTSTGNAIVKI